MYGGNQDFRILVTRLDRRGEGGGGYDTNECMYSSWLESDALVIDLRTLEWDP